MEYSKMDMLYSMMMREKILKLNPYAILQYSNDLQDWLIVFAEEMHRNISFPVTLDTFVLYNGDFPKSAKFKLKNAVLKELILAHNDERVCYLAYINLE